MTAHLPWHEHVARLLDDLLREPTQGRLMLLEAIARVYVLRGELLDHLVALPDLAPMVSPDERAAAVLMAVDDAIGRDHRLHLVTLTAWRLAMQLAKPTRDGQDMIRAAYDLGLALAAEDRGKALEALATLEAKAAKSKAARKETFEKRGLALRSDVLTFAREQLALNPHASAANIQRLYRDAHALPVNNSNREAKIINAALGSGELVRTASG